eukprot:6213713-Pleurochrysis_carterae.AAC.2
MAAIVFAGNDIVARRSGCATICTASVKDCTSTHLPVSTLSPTEIPSAFFVTSSRTPVSPGEPSPACFDAPAVSTCMRSASIENAISLFKE